MADNTITITGNVTRDPELRFTGNNQAVCTFGLAVNRRWQNRQSQEWEESTSFFDVVCWGTLADNVADSLAKGTRVIVNGRLEQRSWETQDGEKRSKVEVIADEVGPSLRWATAKAEKTTARNGSGPGPDRDRGQSGGPSGGQSGSGPGGGYDRQDRGTYQPAASAPAYQDHGQDSGEEPF
jgi:single-strand DNA-binding protein